MHRKILKGKDFQPEYLQTTLGEFLFDLAEKFKENICHIDADLDQSETYETVKTKSVRLAISLQNKGLTSEDVVCTCAYNSLDNSIPLLASQFLGAKIAHLDPTLSLRSTKHLLLLVKPKFIFTDLESLDLIENSVRETKIRSEIIVFGESKNCTNYYDLLRPCLNEETFRPIKVDVHRPAVILFSSGTTGLPKGITHSNFSFLQILENSTKSGFSNRGILHYTTFYWISGILIMCQCFLHGSSRVFARTMEGESTLKIIEKYKIDSTFMAPLFTYQLTKVQNIKQFDLSSFRNLLTGGTSLSTTQFTKLTQIFPHTNIIFGYGLSETGIISCFDPSIHQDLIKTKIGSCGKVTAKVLLKIVNVDTEEQLGPHQKGEIRVKCDGQMIGYYGEDSSSDFDKDGFLKTGDIGYYDEDECLYVVERIKEMFKYKSWHIVPSSIEAVLLEHPAVKEAVVYGIPMNEEGEIPGACVVLKENTNVDKEEIEKFVEDRVSEREKLRGGVIFVQKLPKTPTGKVIRNEVKNLIKTM